MKCKDCKSKKADPVNKMCFKCFVKWLRKTGRSPLPPVS